MNCKNVCVLVVFLELCNFTPQFQVADISLRLEPFAQDSHQLDLDLISGKFIEFLVDNAER
jgi:hypothetical protein